MDVGLGVGYPPDVQEHPAIAKTNRSHQAACLCRGLDPAGSLRYPSVLSREETLTGTELEASLEDAGLNFSSEPQGDRIHGCYLKGRFV